MNAMFKKTFIICLLSLFASQYLMAGFFNMKTITNGINSVSNAIFKNKRYYTDSNYKVTENATITNSHIKNAAIFSALVYKCFDQNLNFENINTQISKFNDTVSEFKLLNYHVTANKEVIALIVLDTKNATLYVNFKGTSPQSQSDLINDAKIGLGDLTIKILQNKLGHKTTKGFVTDILKYDVTFKLIQQLIAEIEQYKEHFTKIVVSGHSLGGAMAQIAYSLIKKDKKLITFNAPGLSIWNANQYDPQVNHLIYNGDIVCWFGNHTKGNILYLGSFKLPLQAHSMQNILDIMGLKIN